MMLMVIKLLFFCFFPLCAMQKSPDGADFESVLDQALEKKSFLNYSPETLTQKMLACVESTNFEWSRNKKLVLTNNMLEGRWFDNDEDRVQKIKRLSERRTLLCVRKHNLIECAEKEKIEELEGYFKKGVSPFGALCKTCGNGEEKHKLFTVLVGIVKKLDILKKFPTEKLNKWLVKAAEKGAAKTPFAKLLLENGASATTECAGETVLHKAVRAYSKAPTQDTSFVELLFEYKACPNTKNKKRQDGRTPFHEAALIPKIAELFLAQGADMHAKSHSSGTPFLLAAIQDALEQKIETLKPFLPWVETEFFNDPKTLLHAILYAIKEDPFGSNYSKYSFVIEKLIERGSPLLTPDSFKNTPLQLLADIAKGLLPNYMVNDLCEIIKQHASPEEHKLFLTKINKA